MHKKVEWSGLRLDWGCTALCCVGVGLGRVVLCRLELLFWFGFVYSCRDEGGRGSWGTPLTGGRQTGSVVIARVHASCPTRYQTNIIAIFSSCTRVFHSISFRLDPSTLNQTKPNLTQPTRPHPPRPKPIQPNPAHPNPTQLNSTQLNPNKLKTTPPREQIRSPSRARARGSS